MRAILIASLLVLAAFAVQVQEQSTLQTHGPADLLLDHLTEIETDIRTEQFEHQSLYDSQHAQCSDEIAAREQAISDGEDALRRAESHYTRCDSSHQEAEADLAQVIAYQAQVSANLQGLAIRREAERQEFQTLIEDELDPAIRAVEGAFPIIDEFANGATSFVQVAKHMGGTFKELVRSGRGASMAGALTALLQLGQSGSFDQGELAQVKVLFEQLLDDLKQSKASAIEIESGRQEVYETTVAEFNAILEKLAATQTELTNYSAEMAACLVEEQAIIDQASAKIDNNKKALGYAVDMCSAFEDEYQHATAGRKAEIELLEKLKDFIHEQAEIFGEYGAEDSKVLDEYKSTYTGQVGAFLQLRQEKSKVHRDRMKKALGKARALSKQKK